MIPAFATLSSQQKNTNGKSWVSVCTLYACARFFLTYHLFHNLGIAVITSYYHLMVMIILPWLFFSLVARKLTKCCLPQRKVRPEKLQILVTISCIVTMRCEVRPVHVDPAPHPGVAPVRRSWWWAHCTRVMVHCAPARIAPRAGTTSVRLPTIAPVCPVPAPRHDHPTTPLLLLQKFLLSHSCPHACQG